MKNIKSILLLGVLLFVFSFYACDGSKENTIVVNIFSSTGGTVEGGGVYDSSSAILVKAVANDGFIFENWRGYKSGKIVSSNVEYIFKTDKDISLIAYFIEDSGQIPLISESENIDIDIIPNYGNNVPRDKLLVLTRYIGDLFINDGISKEKSGVVNKDGNTKMVINTLDLEKRALYRQITGGGPHIWISKRFSDELRQNPWAEKDELVLQMNASVPLVELRDKDGKMDNHGFTANQSPVTQLSFGFYLYDKSSEKTFAYIIPIYESRGTYQESANNSDTFVSFISSPLEDNSKYITKSQESEHLQSQPFSDKRFFKMSLTKANLLKGIKDTNAKMSEDLSNYQVTFVGVLFELPNYVKDGHNTSMVNISDFSVYIK